MSDLSDAVFGGQLLGHLISGEELTQAVITDAAMTANLSEHMIADDHGLTEVGEQILEAKVAQVVAEKGYYSPADLNHDHFIADHAAGIEDFLHG